MATIEQVMEAIDKQISIMEGDQFAVFDFDNTCIIGDIGGKVVEYIRSHNLYKYPEFQNMDISAHFEKLMREHGKEKAYRFNSQTFAGFSNEELSEITTQVINDQGLVINTQTAFLREYLIGRGVKNYIISASNQPIIETAFESLFPQFKDHVEIIGVCAEMKNGKKTKKLIEPVTMFAGKLLHIKKNIDNVKKPIFVAGDSLNDKEMLKDAHVRVVVDYGNPMAQYASLQGEEKNWYLLKP